MEVTIGQHQLATWLSAIHVAKFKGKKTVFELVYFTWIMVQEKKSARDIVSRKKKHCMKGAQFSTKNNDQGYTRPVRPAIVEGHPKYRDFSGRSSLG
jgi:hypothetical protein